MSAATSLVAPAPTAPASAAVEYARSLPPEAKRAVFLALLREAVQMNGAGVMPVEDEDGNPFGCYLSPGAVAARADEALPRSSAEREAELAKRQNEPGRLLTEDELRAWLKQATPAQSQ